LDVWKHSFGEMKLLERIAQDDVAADKEILRGLKYTTIKDLAAQLGVSIATIAEAVDIAPSTLTRRSNQQRFQSGESERLVRIARLWYLAVSALGSIDGARSWLSRPQSGLGGRLPLEVARSEPGARVIEGLLHRIDRGLVA
jgi:putative toxin-antitoxin system antitoxin component (TIGR02293 family)